MVDLRLFDALLEDPVGAGALVAIELVGGVDAAGDGPAGEDLGLGKGFGFGGEWGRKKR